MINILYFILNFFCSIPPDIPSSECYRYRLQVIDDDCDDEESSSSSSSDASDDESNELKTNKSNSVEIFENVAYTQISYAFFC